MNCNNLLAGENFSVTNDRYSPLHNTPSTHPKSSAGRMMRSCFAGSRLHCSPNTQCKYPAPPRPAVLPSQSLIRPSASRRLLPRSVRGSLVRLSLSRVPRRYATTSDGRTYFEDFKSPRKPNHGIASSVPLSSPLLHGQLKLLSTLADDPKRAPWISRRSSPCRGELATVFADPKRSWQ